MIWLTLFQKSPYSQSQVTVFVSFEIHKVRLLLNYVREPNVYTTLPTSLVTVTPKRVVSPSSWTTDLDVSSIYNDGNFSSRKRRSSFGVWIRDYDFRGHYNGLRR